MTGTASATPWPWAGRRRGQDGRDRDNRGHRAADVVLVDGATGVRVLRADSAFYGHEVIAAAKRHGARFSITARQDRAVRKAIDAICPDNWTTIQYTNAVFDQDQQRSISDAEVAEIEIHGLHLPTHTAENATARQ
jgi:hypothetical protein